MRSSIKILLSILNKRSDNVSNDKATFAKSLLTYEELERLVIDKFYINKLWILLKLFDHTLFLSSSVSISVSVCLCVQKFKKMDTDWH